MIAAIAVSAGYGVLNLPAVSNAVSPNIISFSVTPVEIDINKTVTVTWSATNSAFCSIIQNIQSTATSKPTSGSGGTTTIINVKKSGYVKLKCTNYVKTAEKIIGVFVIDPNKLQHKSIQQTNTNGTTGVALYASVDGTVKQIPFTTNSTSVGGVNCSSGIPNDLNNDRLVNAVDVQLIINGALGLASGACLDVNGSGGPANATDVQLVIRAALDQDVVPAPTGRCIARYSGYEGDGDGTTYGCARNTTKASCEYDLGICSYTALESGYFDLNLFSFFANVCSNSFRTPSSCSVTPDCDAWIWTPELPRCQWAPN